MTSTVVDLKELQRLDLALARARVELNDVLDRQAAIQKDLMRDIASRDAEIVRLAAWITWARTRLLDGGRGDMSLLGVTNVLVGLERALEGEDVSRGGLM